MRRETVTAHGLAENEEEPVPLIHSAGLRLSSRQTEPDGSPGVTIVQKNARDQDAWLSWNAG